MNFLNLKYRNRLQRIFLGVYLLLVISGIFHFHHFDFSLTQKLEPVKKTITNDFQIIGGNIYECIIQQNLTNLQTALLIFNHDKQFITDLSLTYQNFKSHNYLKQVYLSNNLLRAPPSLS
jgi:hypothetical protein